MRDLGDIRKQVAFEARMNSGTCDSCYLLGELLEEYDALLELLRDIDKLSSHLLLVNGLTERIHAALPQEQEASNE